MKARVLKQGEKMSHRPCRISRPPGEWSSRSKAQPLVDEGLRHPARAASHAQVAVLELLPWLVAHPQGVTEGPDILALGGQDLGAAPGHEIELISKLREERIGPDQSAMSILVDQPPSKGAGVGRDGGASRRPIRFQPRARSIGSGS
jgi:hypothetical protein